MFWANYCPFSAHYQANIIFCLKISIIVDGRSENSSNLQASKKMSGSVSWLEWTQQLQAYIAWVNSQLRKRPDLRPVQDLRTDLQSGEVLAQLIEIISGEKIVGIQYTPESIQVLYSYVIALHLSIL